MDGMDERINALETQVNYLLGASRGAHIVVASIFSELMNANSINRSRLRELLDGMAVSLEGDRGALDGQKLAQHDVALSYVRRFVMQIEQA